MTRVYNVVLQLANQPGDGIQKNMQQLIKYTQNNDNEKIKQILKTCYLQSK